MLLSTENYLLPLSACSRAISHVVGGKASGLGELARLGVLCPGGFVLSTKAFETQCELLGVDGVVCRLTETHDSYDSSVLSKVRDAIIGADLPDGIAEEVGTKLASLPPGLLAIRSSANVEDSTSATFAGAFESVLGVDIDRVAVSEAIKKCWASVFSPSVASYLDSIRCQGKLTARKISMAVIIQHLIPAAVSGVAVTALPGLRGEMLVEAGFGVGAVVSGDGRHDKYVVNRGSGRVISSVVSRQGVELVVDGGALKPRPIPEERINRMKLSEDLIHRVSQTALSLEARLGSAQSVEFAVDGPDVWVTQARSLPRPAFDLPEVAQSLHGTW